MCETGQFAVLWRGIADKFKLDVEFMPGDWRHGADLEQIEARLAADRRTRSRPSCVVHNETSTGCVTHPLEVRKAMDRTKHPALLMVDTISGLGSMEYEHDAWGIDVSVGGFAEGHDAAAGPRLQRGLGKGARGRQGQSGDCAPTGTGKRSSPSTRSAPSPIRPRSTCCSACSEAITMLEEEGLENVFARHKRHSEATRAAVKVWGWRRQCQDPQGAHSPALTGVRMPDGHDADHFRKVVLENFDMSLGTGLNKVKGKVFRIGHIGHFNDLMLMGTLSGVEMGLDLAKVPHRARRRARGHGRAEAPRGGADAEGRGGLNGRRNKLTTRKKERAMNAPVSSHRRPALFRRGRHRAADLQPPAGAQRADLCDVRADGRRSARPSTPTARSRR